MSLFTRIRDHFRPPQQGGQTLRNKAGGMAFVRGVQEFPELNGHVVTTVCIEDGSKWAIDPAQPVKNVRAGITFTDGRVSKGGESGNVTAIADDCLVPFGDPGITTEEVKELFSPSPAKESEKV